MWFVLSKHYIDVIFANAEGRNTEPIRSSALSLSPQSDICSLETLSNALTKFSQDYRSVQIVPLSVLGENEFNE